MARTFAYTRVSTSEQTVDNQLAEIKAAGFTVEPQRMITETISGSTAAQTRPQFVRLLDKLESGDVLVVSRLDRLGRNSIDVQMTVAKLEAMGVRVHCLVLGGVDLTSPAGKMTMGVIAAVAQFERDLLIERTVSGQKRAMAAGVRFGRPSVLKNGQKAEVLAQLAGGKSISAVARDHAVSRATILRAAKANTREF